MLPETLAAVIAAAPQTQDVCNRLDLHGLIEFRAHIEDTIKILQQAAAVVNAELLAVDMIDGGGYPIESGGIIKLRGGSKREKYDQALLIDAYGQAIADELGLDPTLTTNIFRTACEATGATAPSFSSWRKGIADAHGIILKRYAETVTAPFTYSIEGRSLTQLAADAPATVERRGAA